MTLPPNLDTVALLQISRSVRTEEMSLANSVDLDEAAHFEPSLLGQHSLHRYLFYPE